LGSKFDGVFLIVSYFLYSFLLQIRKTHVFARAFVKKDKEICENILFFYLPEVPLDPLGPVGIEEGGDDRVGVQQQNGEGVQPAGSRAPSHVTLR
jgi:hypothetical protein